MSSMDKGPSDMTGTTRRHARMSLNVGLALRARIDPRSWEALAFDGGVAIQNGAVRFPDALVAAATGSQDDRLIPDVIVVFEVVSPSSVRNDRFVKPGEYQTVPSIRCYVIVEQSFIGLTVLSRPPGVFDWTSTTLTADDTLDMPEIGTAIPVREIYAGTTVPETLPDDGR